MTLPLATRLPLIAGLGAFLAAVATTQIATRALSREAEREAERLGQVYLDGLAAAALPALLAGDHVALTATLERAIGFQEGVRERRLVVAGRDGTVLAEAGLPDDAAFPPPFRAGQPERAWRRDEDGRAAWVQRALPPVSGGAILAAKLDFSEAADRRERIGFLLLLLDLALAAIAAGAAALVARRALAPFLTVAEALDRAGGGNLAPIADAERPAPGTEAARLAQAFDLMVRRLDERERLAARLAEQEQAALLGRLAATVAHEVRNPLAGMLTALDTVRRFGGDQAARDEALALVERGLRQIEGVVQATLVTHRGEPEPRPLLPADIEDLRVLLAPEARRRGVVLDWDAALPEAFPAEALPVRQALLNLMLNAVAASPRGGRVALRARVTEGGDLAVEVSDQGAGLPEPVRAGIAGGTPPGRGLGLGVVMEQVGRLDARIEVDSVPGMGTRIRLLLPPRPVAETLP
jgi:signal transduction histidine kinase